MVAIYMAPDATTSRKALLSHLCKLSGRAPRLYDRCSLPGQEEKVPNDRNWGA